MSLSVPSIFISPEAVPLKLEKISFTKACTKAILRSFKLAERSNVGDAVLLSILPSKTKLSLSKNPPEEILALTS